MKAPKAYIGVGGRTTFSRKMAIITCMKSNIGDHTLYSVQKLNTSNAMAMKIAAVLKVVNPSL